MRLQDSFSLTRRTRIYLVIDSGGTIEIPITDTNLVGEPAENPFKVKKFKLLQLKRDSVQRSLREAVVEVEEVN